MKKIMHLAITLGLVLSQFSMVMAAEVKAKDVLPIRIAGSIESEQEKVVVVKAVQNDNRVSLNINESTYIIEAETGLPGNIKNRKGEEVVAYYGPITTRSIPPQSNAVALFINIPQDFLTPSYAKVEAVEVGQEQVKVTIDGGDMIVSIPNDTTITPYLTKNIITNKDIKVGSELVLWYGAVAMSNPMQTTAKKVVLLNTKSAEEPSTPPAVKEAKQTSSSIIEKNTKFKDADIAKGMLPKFIALFDQTATNKLNKDISDIYDKTIKTAKEINSKDVTFSYEIIESLPFESIIIKSTIVSANTSAEFINTIVVNYQMRKSIDVQTLQSVLGVNAYKIANDVISDTIAKAKQGTYSTDENAFKGIKSDPMFFVQDDSVVIIFEKYAISPGSTGTPMFKIAIKDVKNITLGIDQTYMSKDICMIPLRAVAEENGFEVSWDEADKSIMLVKGKEVHKIFTNKDKYDEKTLGQLPEIKDGKTFVPVSYFEVVLGGSYTIDKDKVTLTFMNK